MVNHDIWFFYDVFYWCKPRYYFGLSKQSSRVHGQLLNDVCPVLYQVLLVEYDACHVGKV
jgi:hypothetical protein